MSMLEPPLSYWDQEPVTTKKRTGTITISYSKEAVICAAPLPLLIEPGLRQWRKAARKLIRAEFPTYRVRFKRTVTDHILAEAFPEWGYGRGPEESISYVPQDVAQAVAGLLWEMMSGIEWVVTMRTYDPREEDR